MLQALLHVRLLLSEHNSNTAPTACAQEVDMIPLMMSKDFKPKGWLGLILGTRMWCKSDLVQV